MYTQYGRMNGKIRAFSFALTTVMVMTSTILTPMCAKSQAQSIAIERQSHQLAMAVALLNEAGATASLQIPKPGDAVPNQDIYAAFLRKLIDLIDEKAKTPDGTQSKREAAFQALTLIDFAMFSGLIALPVGTGFYGAGVGLVAGATIGVIAGLPIADAAGGTVLLTAGIGTAAGGAIGTGAGIVGSLAGTVGATTIHVALMLYLNDKYPPENTALNSGQRIQVATIGNFGFAPQAGAWESMAIHLVDAVFTDKAVTLANLWHRMPGLTPQQKDFLEANSPLRKMFQDIAFIKTNKRLTPTSPVAQPLSGWMKEAVLLLSADEDAVERLWLNALGVAGFDLKVSGGKLRLSTPPGLVAVGAPADVSAALPGGSLKVGGDGGAFDPYLKVSVTAGPFDLSLGTASIVDSGANANLVKVKYEIKKGSKLGDASLKLKWNGPEATLNAFSPSLSSDVTVSVYFRPDGLGMAIEKVDLGDMSIKPNFPSDIPDNIPGLSDLIKQLGDGLGDTLKSLVGKDAPFINAFNSVKSQQTKALCKHLDDNAPRYGAMGVSQVNSLVIQGGKMKASVRAQVLDSAKLPKASMTPQQIAADFRSKNPAFGVILKPAVQQLPKPGGSP